MNQKRNIAFLISGKGSHLNNFFEFINKKKLNAQISLIIGSKENLLGFNFAKEKNIPHYCIEYKKFKNEISLYSEKITQLLIQHNIDFVFMAGFLSPYYVPKIYEYKVLNIHPSLIPSFCGKGYYGTKVYKKVLESGVKITGVTVHFVNNNYDQGPIIFQKTIPIKYTETLESLEEKTKKLEKKIYPLILKILLEKRIKIHKNYIQILNN